jgi:hypothetical protein
MRVGLRAPHRPCDLPTGRPAVERGRGSRHSTAFPYVGADVCHRGHVEQRHGLAYRCLEANTEEAEHSVTSNNAALAAWVLDYS